MIIELPLSRADVAIPLFTQAWADRAYIEAFFEGRQAGRLFIDDPERPTAALLARPYEYYVAGEPSDEMRRFIADAPEEPGIFQRLYGYVPTSHAWHDAMLADHGDRLAVIDRRGFTYPHASVDPWRDQLPDGATMRMIDAALAERIDRELDEYLGVIWGGSARFVGGYEQFAAGGFGCALMFDDMLGSVAFTGATSHSEANIIIVTAPSLRRQGLSSLTCHAYIETCLTRGLMPTWDADLDNIASWRLARKLGFIEHEPFWQLSPPNYGKLALSHGRWFPETEPNSGLNGWRRAIEP